MKIVLFVISIFFYLPTLACTCSKLDDDELDNLKRDSDYIIIGTASEILDPNEKMRRYQNEEKQGITVKIKVDKVIKGPENLPYINIYQEGSSCSRIFRLNEIYIIFGASLKGVKSIKSISRNENSPPPPPLPLTKDKSLHLYNVSKKDVSYWDRLAKNRSLITTNFCESFNVNSQAGQNLMKNLNTF